MMIVAIALAGAASAASAGMYLRRRRWIDAVLVMVAAAALGGLAAEFRLPAQAVPAMTVAGDGLTEAEWRDLPARALSWTRPSGGEMHLDFPRRLSLGRMFTLTVRMPGAHRMQLLAENGQVIAEGTGNAKAVSVQWLPPAAELLVLRARLVDAAGKILAEGPVPVHVTDSAPLQVQGRFGAPSFDLRALNDLLKDSGALLDWQVALGKSVSRSETARSAAAPNLLLIDAAWFEHAAESARGALLAQVAQGTPLVILGASAADPKLWQRAVQLDLKPQPENRTAGPLAMPVAPFNPSGPDAGAWSGDGAVWARQWQGGRIAWVGVGDWHKHAIAQPQQLGMWWQGVLDAAGVRREEDVVWEPPREMPFPGQRLEVCARGVRGDAVFSALNQKAVWQRRPDKADASCVAVWPPRQPGWLKVETQQQSQYIYVFAPGDWPQWQAAERRDATARFAARTPVAAVTSSRALPDWPFAIVFALVMLALWFREKGGVVKASWQK
ncbi:hypothetical protein Q4S45_22205 [Massilia sp. R2A-15]|uniref:hypothetical protein n=1 Tax=Massilia sp. R2A-15 TaxID=3064278 RepID=UPI0027358106|nr:hypothetical protein [Massilia sp. R2A-15]WLI89372.1 hypothetical protein Q4S45_22205 [Massilia sp. R2A-15]